MGQARIELATSRQQRLELFFSRALSQLSYYPNFWNSWRILPSSGNLLLDIFLPPHLTTQRTQIFIVLQNINDVSTNRFTGCFPSSPMWIISNDIMSSTHLRYGLRNVFQIGVSDRMEQILYWPRLRVPCLGSCVSCFIHILIRTHCAHCRLGADIYDDMLADIGYMPRPSDLFIVDSHICIRICKFIQMIPRQSQSYTATESYTI